MWGCHCLRRFFVVIIVCFLLFLDPVSAVGHLKSHKAPVHILDEDAVDLEQQMLSVKSYALEDFFWTGSGDGAPPPQAHGGWSPPVATTTLLATVFLDPPGHGRPPTSSEEDCVSECPISPGAEGISPTGVGAGPGAGLPPPDQRYWLLTVLRAPTEPPLLDLDSRLANLYRKAFLRQQERHLGIIPTSSSGFRKKHQTSSQVDKNNNTLSASNKKNANSDNPPHGVNVTGSSTLDSSVTEPSLFQQDVENFEEIEDSSISTNSDQDYSVDVPFEYVTNYFSTSPSSVLRVKRSINEQKKLLDNVFTNNTSADGNITSEVAKREVLMANGQPVVEVFLQNITKEGSEDLKVVYWVSVGGRPVPARTAAKDMKLLADSEVVAELGYPITTKAEPYLKTPEHINGAARAGNTQDTWLIVGSITLAAILLLIIVAFLACRLTGGRRKSSGTTRVLREISRASEDNRERGKENMAYAGEKDGKLISVISPSKQKGTQVTEDRYVSPARRYVRGPQYLSNRVSSAGSSGSTSSGSDLSQMNSTLRQRQRLFEQQMQNEYAIVNKKNKTKHRRIRSKKVGIADYTPRTESPVEIRGDGSLQRFLVSGPPSPRSTDPASSDTSCSSVVVRRPKGVVSPTSYLSMPSVKSFPRNNAVEPLSKVLEPLSVRHLDMDSPVHQPRNQLPDPALRRSKDGPTGDINNDCQREKDPQEKGLASILKNPSNLIRLGSMDKDPGVVSPRVWDMHRQRIQDSKMDPRNEALDNSGGANISKMRQRFSELVDDAFSLFGSGSNTPKSTGPQPHMDDVARNLSRCNQLTESHNLDAARRHSAKESNPAGVHAHDLRLERPLTALPPRPPLPRQGTAWGSHTNVPVSRSTSAGAQRRTVVETVPLSSDAASPTDPALPLLQAIRSELNKLPGTSDA